MKAKNINSKIAAIATSVCLVLALLNVAAFAADSSTSVTASGTSSSVTWTLYSDGELNFTPTSGSDGSGTLGTYGAASSVPWYNYHESITSITSSGTINTSSNLAYYFYDCTNLTDLSGLSSWGTSSLVSLNYTFQHCTNLTDLSGLSSWSVSSVDSLNNTFYGCSSLTDLSGLSSWDVSKVESLNYTFQNCTSLTSLSGLSSWTVTSAQTLDYTFSGCTSLSDVSALASWTTTALTALYYTFSGCTSLQTLDFTSWNTSKVTNMECMFSDCTNLTTIYVGTNWTNSAVTTGTNMFTGCTNLVGGNGTLYSSSDASYTMAVIDTSTTTGYLTANIHNTTTSIPQSEYAYTGEYITPVVTITSKATGSTLVEETDYTVSYSSNSKVGTATITITGTGNYTGTLTVTFTITQIEITSITLSDDTFTYDEQEHVPTVTVVTSSGGTSLTEDTDYTVTITGSDESTVTSATDVGTYTVTVTGDGTNVTGTVTASFFIYLEITDYYTVTLSENSFTYNGQAHEPTVTITSKSDSSQTLTADSDYTVAYEDNTDAGTATMTVTGIGDYDGYYTEVTFTINTVSLADLTLDIGITSAIYTGEAIKIDAANITVTDDDGNIISSTNYTISYANNTNVGTATVTLTGTGDNCTSSISATFVILADFQDYFTITLDSDTFTYNGSEQGPTVTITDSNENTLVEDTDYTLTYADNIDAGTATLTITGIGDYDCYASEISYTINPVDISDLAFTTGLKKVAYTGQAITASTSDLKIVDENNNEIPSSGYTVTYKNNTKIGVASVIATGTGNYTGTRIKTFSIIPAKTTLVMAKSLSRRTITVKWKTTKAGGASGARFQIAYKKKKNPSSWSFKKTVKTKIRKRGLFRLMRGQSYYVKIRAFKVVGGTYYYGEWSKQKLVKVQ